MRSVSLRISPGEVVGLLGPNGAGKSTLVKMLVGLVRPDSGEALVLGAPAGRPEARRDIGYLPELFRYQPWLSVAEVVGLHARLRPVPAADRQREVARVLARAGLADRSAERVATLSKGLQQRLGLAVALLGRPRLLLLDEPTSALDPTGRADVRALIDECRAEGTTVLLNSHMLSEVESSTTEISGRSTPATREPRPSRSATIGSSQSAPMKMSCASRPDGAARSTLVGRQFFPASSTRTPTLPNRGGFISAGSIVTSVPLPRFRRHSGSVRPRPLPASGSWASSMTTRKHRTGASLRFRIWMRPFPIIPCWSRIAVDTKRSPTRWL